MRSERGADESDRGAQIAHHERLAETDGAKARAAELEIALLIGVLPIACVISAIDLDDDANAMRKEVYDEAVREDDLAAKGDAELAALEGGPQARFRRGEPSGAEFERWLTN